MDLYRLEYKEEKIVELGVKKSLIISLEILCALAQ